MLIVIVISMAALWLNSLALWVVLGKKRRHHGLEKLALSTATSWTSIFLDQFTEIPTAYSSFLVYQFIVWTFTVVVSHYFLGTPRYGDIDVPIHRWLKKTISVASKPHLFQTARCVLGHSRLSFNFFIEFLLFDDFHLLCLAKWEASWQFQMLHECFWMFHECFMIP
jgi:hypothetical protein